MDKRIKKIKDIIYDIRHDTDSAYIQDLNDNDITELATGIYDELWALMRKGIKND